MLNVQNLSGRRGGRMLFHQIGFRLSKGDLLQITGANGSGKSSLLRLLAGLLSPAEGSVIWDGKSIADDAEAHRARLHYIGHQDALKLELTAADMLGYWQVLRAGSDGLQKDWFGVETFGAKPVRLLSAGQKRRLSLSRLGLDFAALWLLDEPATALDTDAQQTLNEVIMAHRASGGIVIAAVHHILNMSDSQTLAMPGAT